MIEWCVCKMRHLDQLNSTDYYLNATAVESSTQQVEYSTKTLPWSKRCILHVRIKCINYHPYLHNFLACDVRIYAEYKHGECRRMFFLCHWHEIHLFNFWKRREYSRLDKRTVCWSLLWLFSQSSSKNAPSQPSSRLSIECEETTSIKVMFRKCCRKLMIWSIWRKRLQFLLMKLPFIDHY